MKRNILACFGPKDGILSREEKMRQKRQNKYRKENKYFHGQRKLLWLRQEVQTDLLTTLGPFAKFSIFLCLHTSTSTKCISHGTQHD